MRLIELLYILILLLYISITIYIFVVLKEKINLKNNSVVIDRKDITQEDIDTADVKTFKVGEKFLKAGDEVKLKLENEKLIKGVLLGMKEESNSIIVFTDDGKLEECRYKDISKFTLVSKYGKFF